MAKASRQKKAQPQGRSWTTTNPWTHQPDTFVVRISAESLREWERDRVRLKGEGYPDRPPEFDGPTMRGWGDNPARQPLVETTKISLATDPSARLVGSWCASDANFAVKAHLGRRQDGELVLDVSMGASGSPRRKLIRGVKSVQAAGEIANKAAVLLGLPRPAFTTEDQFAADLSAMAEASHR